MRWRGLPKAGLQIRFSGQFRDLSPGHRRQDLGCANRTAGNNDPRTCLMSPSSARGVAANGNCVWRLHREMGQQLRSPQPAFALRVSAQTLLVLADIGTSWSEAFGTRMGAFRNLENHHGASRAADCRLTERSVQGLDRLV